MPAILMAKAMGIAMFAVQCPIGVVRILYRARLCRACPSVAGAGLRVRFANSCPALAGLAPFLAGFGPVPRVKGPHETRASRARRRLRRFARMRSPRLREAP